MENTKDNDADLKIPRKREASDLQMPCSDSLSILFFPSVLSETDSAIVLADRPTAFVFY
jgi:hypothetical protein